MVSKPRASPATKVAFNPSSYQAKQGLGTLQARVAEVQATALARLAPEDFQATAHWRAVPGLAGFLTAAGVDRLAAAPEVDRIDLDVGGRAQLATSVPLIRADLVQAGGNTGLGVTVAVLDSGPVRSRGGWSTHGDGPRGLGGQSVLPVLGSDKCLRH